MEAQDEIALLRAELGRPVVSSANHDKEEGNDAADDVDAPNRNDAGEGDDR